jgi:hypothetical protein
MNTQRLSDRSAYAIVNRRVEQAGLIKASPHDLRRSFITYLLDCDVDIGTVADMAGHADVNTTRIYDRRQKKRNIKAAGKINFFSLVVTRSIVLVDPARLHDKVVIHKSCANTAGIELHHINRKGQLRLEESTLFEQFYALAG